ncbi:acyltransferase family protein [Jejubacter calystegiae]|nr:acyltransferase [Jejubacter calystegiae]
MQLLSLTGIRGLAALYVMLYHFTYGRTFFLWNGYIGVDLFFILSGYILSLVYADKFIQRSDDLLYLSFLKHRFARVYPVYFLALVIMVSINIYSSNVIDLHKISTNIFLMQGLLGDSLVVASWSLSIELVAYFLFPIIIYSVTKNITTIIITIATCLFLVNFITYYNDHQSSGPLDIYRNPLSLIRGLADFMIGVGMYTLSKKDMLPTLRRKHASDYIIVLIILVLACKGLDVICIVLFSMLIFSLHNSESYTKRILSLRPVVYLGDISLSMYLLHPIIFLNFGKDIREIVSQCTTTTNNSMSIIFFVLTLSISMFTYHFLEVPCKKILRRKL